jgi:hypothetical protein
MYLNLFMHINLLYLGTSLLFFITFCKCQKQLKTSTQAIAIANKKAPPAKNIGMGGIYGPG